MKKILIVLLSLVIFSCENNKTDTQNDIALAPAGNEYCRIDSTGGKTILPNGRFITPWGKQIKVAPHPYGLVLSDDGSIAITANSGTNPFSITIIKNFNTENPIVKQIPPGVDTDKGILAAVFMGLVISKDNKYVYVAGGQENKIFIFNIESGEKAGEIDCSESNNQRDYSHGYLGDMVKSSDEKYLYVVDQINFCVNIIDIEKRKVIERVDVGRYPFGIALTPDEKKLYVANVGMYEYKPIGEIDPNNLNKGGLDFPATAYNTKESIEGTVRDGKVVPALGDPNDEKAFSVWAIDLSSKPKVVAKIKTGFLIGEKIDGIPAVGGSSPNSIVATNQYVFVSNGNNDCISVIDAKQDKVIENIKLSIDSRLDKYRGIIPFGLALSPDKKRLFVAESGINAVGVIDVDKRKLLGHIPVGWFPSKLKVTPDGKTLLVANAKGWGSGPNGGSTFVMGPEGSNIGRLMKGTVSVIDISDESKLKQGSEIVLNNNFKFVKQNSAELEWRKGNPIPLSKFQKNSPIKYIVFISKENRTYDEVFGQLKQGRGEPELARYGLKRSFKNKAGTDSLSDIDVMPNHIALAQRFTICDNFYVDSDHSADGHRWLVCTYPNQWVETSVSSAYGGGRRMRFNSKAPGNFVFVGASGAIYPDDYNEAGSMWDHLARNKINYFNFGFSMEHAPGFDDSTLKKSGIRYLINYPLPTSLYDRTSRNYPTYNMAIPDQYRADIFIKEFKSKWIDAGEEMPRLITLMLPNDHGAGDRPWAGYPFRESYMADNDLALGRVIEFLSSTKYWKNMAIIITEDDSQDGVDHVDAHRSLLMIVSPYAKRNYVSKVHYSFGSIFKTIWNLLGVNCLNQYDFGATDLADCFTDKPDFTPFKAHPVDKRMFDPDFAMKAINEGFSWNEPEDLPELDSPEYILKESKERDKKLKKQGK